MNFRDMWEIDFGIKRLDSGEQHSLFATDSGITSCGTVLGADTATNLGRWSATNESTQRGAKLPPSHDVKEEIARVVRQADLVHDVANRFVDDIPPPRDLIGVPRSANGRSVALARVRGPDVRERVAEDVDQRSRQGGEDNVERDGQKHGVGGGVLRRCCRVDERLARFMVDSRTPAVLRGCTDGRRT